MVAERDGLRGLQMSKAWHYRVCMSFGLTQECPLKCGQLTVQMVDRVAHIEFEICRNLIISGAGCVEPACRGAHDFCKAAFDIHVNVFQRPRKREFTRFNLSRNRVQTGFDLIGVGLGYNPFCRQHGAVRF